MLKFLSPAIVPQIIVLESETDEAPAELLATDAPLPQSVEPHNQAGGCKRKKIDTRKEKSVVLLQAPINKKKSKATAPHILLTAPKEFSAPALSKNSTARSVATNIEGRINAAYMQRAAFVKYVTDNRMVGET